MPLAVQTADHSGSIIGPMTTGSSISQQLERQSVLPMESTIPTEMTVEQWRRRRSARARPVPCDHLHDTTTRYDPVEKRT
jgi:hypothetical protein